jgi:carbon-monoxide dehydrogenase medium subunit
MKPASFEYVRPRTIEEALQLLDEHGDEAKVLAGGQSLVPMMNLRLARPGVVIDINGLKELDYHRQHTDYIAVGALTRHATLRDSPLIRESCPLMSAAYHYVAHGTVRNRGTLCGNLCHADPASEMPAVMLACEASMVLRSAKGERIVPAEEFFQGLYATAVQPNEILVEVRIPVRSAQWGYSFQEVSVRQGDFAMTLVASLLNIQDGRIVGASVAYAGISDRALRFEQVEKRLVGQEPSDSLFSDIGAELAANLDVNQDVHASEAYRRDLVRTLTQRALNEAATRAAPTRA